MSKLLILCIMAISTFASAQTSKATTIRKTFSRTTSVSDTIQADPAIVWALLTNAADNKRWNSTIVSRTYTLTPNGKDALTFTMVEKLVQKK